MKRESISLGTLTDLRRQARRRLIGSIVLLSIAAMVLWNVVADHQPQTLGQDVFVQQNPETSNIDLSQMDEMIPQMIAQAEVLPPLETPEISLPNAEGKSTALPPLPAKVTGVDATTADAKKAIRADASAALAPFAIEGKAKPKMVHPRDILEGRFDPDLEQAVPKQAQNKASVLQKQVWVIQLAALSDEAKIESLREKLKQLGVAAQFSEIDTSKGTVTRVRVGPFHDKNQSNTMMKRLNQQGLPGIMIAQQGAP